MNIEITVIMILTWLSMCANASAAFLLFSRYPNTSNKGAFMFMTAAAQLGGFCTLYLIPSAA